MDNKIIITRSGKEDREEILLLLDGARGKGLTPEEKAQAGFVQGVIDEELLVKFQEGLGVYIVKIEGKIVAAAFTSRIGITEQGPIVEAARTVFNKDKYLQASEVFQYGPVVVSREFKGKGILTRLVLFLCSKAEGKFKRGLAFVEEANKVSLAIHRHYFEKEFDTFVFKGRKYFIFLFDPKELLQKYSSTNDTFTEK